MLLKKLLLLSALVVGQVLCDDGSNATETDPGAEVAPEGTGPDAGTGFEAIDKFRPEAAANTGQEVAEALETGVGPEAHTDERPEVGPEVPPEQEAPQPLDVTEPTAERPVEPLDIHGLDNRQPVFHQKHQVPNGSVAGTYGYYDSLGRYHVLNYVRDRFGIRIVSDYAPFEGPNRPPHDLEGSAAQIIPDRRPPPAHLQGHPRPLQHRPQEREPLAESDGDNLLRDEHSIIRTTVVPPPGAFFNYPGSEAAGTQALPYNLHRRNGTQPFGRRIPYPYENPLYPLLYTEPGKRPAQGHAHDDDDVNDTSGLDTSDGVSEVPSKPIRSRPVLHRPPGPVRFQHHNHVGYEGNVYARPQYQQTAYYPQYAHVPAQHQQHQQFLVPLHHHYQQPVRPQGYYPQQQYRNYYYQPVVAGYNAYEHYNYGYNHR